MKKGKKRKRILFLARLYDPHIGGVEKHVKKISGLLMEEGDMVTVLCEQHNKKLKTNEKIDGISVIRIPISSSEKNKKFGIWKWVIKNRKFFNEFDIIHIHDVFYWIAPLLPYLDKKRVFVTFHGYEGYPVRLISKIQKKITEKYCNGSICVGDYIKKWYGIGSNAVIYGGVDMPQKIPVKAKNQRSAVFFGRLDVQTGIKEYYKAFLNLKGEYRDFSLEIVGEGKYARQIKKLSISPFKSDVSKYVQNNRFIFVSRYLSMLEAMVEKRLVIAVCDDPIKRDYLIDSPFSKYVDICNSSKEIENRVRYYMDNPQAEEERIGKAYSWAKKQTWQKVTDCYLKLWGIN